MNLAFSSNAYLNFSIESAIERIAGLGYRGPPQPAPAPATLIAAHNLA